MSQNQRKRHRIADAASNAESLSEDDDEDSDQFDLLLQQMEGINEYHNIAYTVRRTMLEIAQIKERNCERRHRELMAMLKSGFASESLIECRPVVEENADSTGESAYISTETQEVSEVKATKATVPGCQQEFIAMEEIESTPIQSASGPSTALPGLQTRKDEYHKMRQRLIAIQKQKMADRERKKQEQERQKNTIEN